MSSPGTNGGIAQAKESRAPATTPSLSNGRAALLPLPPVPAIGREKAALGERLFFEKRLSRDNTISCASCHDPARGGTDRRPVSIGIDGHTGPINAPTVFNAALNFVQFWDGRAASLEEQAAGPVHNPLEMGANWALVISKLTNDESYRLAFAQIYPQGITGETIADAIAAFEHTLLTPSRFDLFLAGNPHALNKQEQDGYRRFLDYGCASCHQGANIGGNMFQRFGVMADYFAGRTPTAADLGRFNVTQREADRHVFKVPSLRNVALTAPYFHDASAQTLEEAIMIMGRVQLGRELTIPDTQAIAAFLKTLNGHWRGHPLP
ncbi:MAG: cytochrome-c peroxidase [Dechloromonas sp.]|nr:cytochrome-c peroxidase [Dechloromonas sp.]